MGGKAVLLVTIGFGFILGYISLNVSGMSVRAVDNMSMYASTTESHNLASTGANVALAKFYQDTSWFGTISQNFDGGEETPLGHLAGSFTATMTNLGGNKARLQSVSDYTMSSGEVLHDTVEVYFDTEKENSFSLYAWMTNIEGNIWWITGDTVWGRVHSNDYLRVNGKPVFYEKVTTSKGFWPKPGESTNKAVFKGGYETGVAKINFPSDLSAIEDAANSGGRFYNGNIWVVLTGVTAANENGLAFIRTSQAGPNIDTVDLSDPSFNGVIMGDSRVNVLGTLDGGLTIASSTDIYVQNDIIYENRNTTTTDDVLGLVAEQNVVVANNAANNSNCQIDASIFCRAGSFKAENYSTRPVSGNLYVKGSIVQQARGAVGTFSGSPPVLNHGFYKRYRYDDRLADPNFRPPFYPGFWVSTYSIANWWENVRIPKYAQ